MSFAELANIRPGYTLTAVLLSNPDCLLWFGVVWRTCGLHQPSGPAVDRLACLDLRLQVSGLRIRCELPLLSVQSSLVPGGEDIPSVELLLARCLVQFKTELLQFRVP